MKVTQECINKYLELGNIINEKAVNIFSHLVELGQINVNPNYKIIKITYDETNVNYTVEYPLLETENWPTTTAIFRCPIEYIFMEDFDKTSTIKECNNCKKKFIYDSSKTEMEEERDMSGYHEYYYAKCPHCGARVLVKYIK